METIRGEVLGQGRFLRLVRRDGWEFVERTTPVRAAFIGALTDDGCLLLTKEYRVPVGKTVVGFPAGLVGDTAGLESESIVSAVKRELLEEAGYEADSVTRLTEGPTSAGQITEVISIVLARGLRKVAAGGGIEGENILVYPVPLSEVDAWIDVAVNEGCVVDPKVYTGLYFIHKLTADAANKKVSSTSEGPIP